MNRVRKMWRSCNTLEDKSNSLNSLDASLVIKGPVVLYLFHITEPLPHEKFRSSPQLRYEGTRS